jgi:hypothetical protein
MKVGEIVTMKAVMRGQFEEGYILIDAAQVARL